MVIDTQTHLLPAGVRRLLQDLPAHPQSDLIHRAADPYFDLGHRVPLMDGWGVDVAVVSLLPMPLQPDAALAVELASIANDDVLAACAEWPGRFLALGHLPLPDVDASLRELDRIGANPLLRGICVMAGQTEYRPDELGVEPVLARAAELGLPIVIHPTVLSLDFGPAFAGFGLESSLQAMVSHSLVAARVALSGMLDRIGGLELILPNLGGVLPFLAERFDTRQEGPAAGRFTDYLRTRMYVDACGYPAGVAWRAALDAVGADRILLGSDYPARPVKPHLEAIRAAVGDPAQQSAILGENARRWFDSRRPRAPRD